MYDAGEGRRGGGGRREQPGPEAGQARQQALHDVSQVEIIFYKHLQYGAPFVFVFVPEGGKCERLAFRFVPKNKVSETEAP